jgi:hypothetical protein
MSKSETTDTGAAGEPDALTDKVLEAVAGGDPATAASARYLAFLIQYSGGRAVPPPDP